MLLAMIVDNLRREQESRDLEWIIKQQNPSLPELESELPGSGWFAKFAGLLVNHDAKKDAKLIRAVLPIAVEQGLLAASKEPGETILYSTTEKGRLWSESQYAGLGRERLHDDDSLTRQIDAVQLCETLLKNGSKMTATDLQNTAFSPLERNTEDRAGLLAQQQAYNKTITVIFERAVSSALEDEWIIEAEGHYCLTDKGKDESTTFFDHWR